MSIPKLLQKKPRAIIFDTDNTLYPYEPAHKEATRVSHKKACKLLGVSLQEFSDAFIIARNEVKEQLNSTASSHSRLLYYQRTIELLKFNTQILMTLDLEQTYWRTFLSNCVLFPGLKDFILDLRNAGVMTAIITDLTAQIQFRKIIYFGLDDYFDYVVTSEESGVDKPNKAPFEMALKKIQAPAEEIWMVGDCFESDINGANAFNILTLQKKHKGVLVNSNADYVFSDYIGLSNKLKWLK